jgi:RNA polymerase sigma-70 factor (ECF subfamily)
MLAMSAPSVECRPVGSDGIPSRWAQIRGKKEPVPASTGSESDLQLVRRMQAGDAAAFSEIYDRYAAQVHGLCRMVLRDDRQAEEATHDVFLGLLQNPAGYDPSRGGFAGWLLRVARNRAIDLLRRRREHPFAAAGASDDGQDIDPLANIADPDLDPGDQVVMTLMARDVRRALSHLAPDHRKLLEMAYFGGLTQREISDTLDRPLGTVKSQIRAAMQRMAKLLGPESSLGSEHPIVPSVRTIGPDPDRQGGISK